MTKNKFIKLLNKPISINISKKDISVFLRQLSALLQAGVSIDESILILKNQRELKSLKYYLENIYNSLIHGNSIAKALKDEKIFDEFLISMINSGEQTGQLSLVCDNLADYYEKEYEINRRLKSALIYPIILFITMIFVLLFVFTYILPTFIELFEDNSLRLPLVTRVLIGLSSFINNNFIFILSFLLIIILIYRLILNNKNYRYKIHKFRCRIPLIGKNRKDIITGRISRGLSIVITNSVPFVEGLEIVNEGIENLYFKNEIENIIVDIKNGNSVSKTFNESYVFPNLFKAMISVGDETGKLGENLEKVSNYYEKETDYAIKSMVAIFEPTMIILMSLIVGLVVIAIATPMFDLVNNYNI